MKKAICFLTFLLAFILMPKCTGNAMGINDAKTAIEAEHFSFDNSVSINGGSSASIAAPKLTTAASGTTGVSVKWEAVPGAERYRVFRRTEGGTWKGILNTYTISTVDTTAESGVKYYYAVRCTTADGSGYTSALSNSLSVTYIRMPKVNSLTSQSNGVLVKWDAIPGAAKYRVFRKTEGGAYSGIVNTTSSSYVDTTALKGVKYWYTVRCTTADGKAYTSAIDNNGLSITYDNGQLAQPVLISTASGASGVSVKWNPVAGAARYRVFRKTEGEAWKGIINTYSTGTVDSTAESGVKYFYAVRCTTADGKTYTSPLSKELSLTYISRPKMTSVTATSSGVKVDWEAVPGAPKYRVFRKTEGGSFKGIANTSTNSYVDTTAVSGETYYYTVRVTSADGSKYLSENDPVGISLTYLKVNSVIDLLKAKFPDGKYWNHVTGPNNHQYVNGVIHVGDSCGDIENVVSDHPCAGHNCPDKVGDYACNCYANGVQGCGFAAKLAQEAYGYMYFERYSGYHTDISKVKPGDVIQYFGDGATGYGAWVFVTGVNGSVVTVGECNWGSANDPSRNCIIGWGRKVDLKKTTSYNIYPAPYELVSECTQPVISSTSCISDGVKISWGKVSGAAKYKVLKKDSNGTWKAIKELAETSYVDSDVVNGNTYYYSVVCVSANGEYISSYDKDGVAVKYDYTESKLVALRKKFPSGKYWNHVKPASEAGTSCYNEAHSDMVTSSPCPHHQEGVPAPVGLGECNYFDGGWQCCGFARKLFYEVYGRRLTGVAGSGKLSYSSIKPGDVIHYYGYDSDAKDGHWVFVLDVKGSVVTIAEANYKGLCKINWDRQLDLRNVSSYNVYSAPYSCK